MSVGCLEARFFAVFLEIFLSGLPEDFSLDGDGWKPTKDMQYDRNEWPKLRAFLRKGFSLNSRDNWTDIFHGMFQFLITPQVFFSHCASQGSDACAVPVLTPTEAASLDSSRSHVPKPHPCVSPETSSIAKVSPILLPGQHTQEVLTELGLSKMEQKKLARDGALGAKAQAEAHGPFKL